MITAVEFLAALVKVIMMVGFLFNVAGILTWVDRRQSSMIQDRIGPNRAVIKIGKFELRAAGLLHTAADGVKFFFKEDFLPPRADKLLFALAPILSMVPVLALIAVIPMADTLCLGHIAPHGSFWSGLYPTIDRSGRCPMADGVISIPMSIAPLNVGILYVFAIAGQGIVGASIAGWSSDNKFSLMGALRAASQMVSYEVAIGLSVVGSMMVYGTVRLDDMARWQGENAWGIFVQPLAFILFFVSVVAESKRIPFDLPEAESELVSGYFTEYSGMKFGMFYFAEYMEIVTSSMLLVCFFLGGFSLPFLHPDGLSVELGDKMIFQQALGHLHVQVFGIVAFFTKTLAICFIQAFVRWSLPRFRYDQLMKLGWRVLLPLSLANIVVTGVVLLVLAQSPSIAPTLKLLADLSQLSLLILFLFLFVRFVVWSFGGRARKKTALGSSAEFAKAKGGVNESPMQA